MGNGSKKGAGEEIAAKGAGIFGKAAEELFELPNKAGKRIHFLRPIKSNHVHARGYRLPRLRKGEKRPVAKYEPAGDAQQDLRDAVNLARRHNKDTGGNYAAYRYIDKDGNERILVARGGKEDEKSREIQTVRLSLRAAGRSFPSGPIESKKHSQDHRGLHRTIALQHHLPAMRRLTL